MGVLPNTYPQVERAWNLSEFNILTTTSLVLNLQDAQNDSSTGTVTDVKCCYCDLSVVWDRAPSSNRLSDVRVYSQYHDCQLRQREYGVCNPVYVPGSWQDSEWSVICDDLKVHGITWVRVDFQWSYIQPSRGVFNWAKFDRFVSIAVSKGVRVLPILCYSTSWANGGQASSCPPIDPADYAAYSAAVASRYFAQGVTHLEVWNEPNLYYNWQPGADSTQYTNLLKATHSAIKAVEPSMSVIIGGLSAAAPIPQHVQPLTFLQQIYDNGGGPYFAALALHPYTVPSLPSSVGTGNMWQLMTAGAVNFREIMRVNGDGWKEVWLTEFGAPTSGTSGQNATTEAGQAEMLLDAIQLHRTYP